MRRGNRAQTQTQHAAQRSKTAVKPYVFDLFLCFCFCLSRDCVRGLFVFLLACLFLFSPLAHPQACPCWHTTPRACHKPQPPHLFKHGPRFVSMLLLPFSLSAPGNLAPSLSHPPPRRRDAFACEADLAYDRAFARRKRQGEEPEGTRSEPCVRCRA